MTRVTLVAAALLATVPAALPAQRIASAATVPSASAAPAARIAADTAGRATTPRAPEGVGPRSGTLTLDRESYSYAPDGRRDPFSSLLDNGELRPLISDLSLAVVAYDPNGGSVAVLRDLNTKEQYRVRVGQQLGRMRVAAIDARRITFTIEEFGFSRQETLALGESNTERTQR